MNHSKFSRAFRAFAESFVLLAEALEEEAQVPPGAETDGTSGFFEELSARLEQEKEAKAAKNPSLKKTVSKKVWDEEPPAEKDPGVIELGDLQEVGRQAIKLLGAPALAKVLRANGLKNLSSAAPKDYPTLYAAIKELTDG